MPARHAGSRRRRARSCLPPADRVLPVGGELPFAPYSAAPSRVRLPMVQRSLHWTAVPCPAVVTDREGSKRTLPGISRSPPAVLDDVDWAAPAPAHVAYDTYAVISSSSCLDSQALACVDACRLTGQGGRPTTTLAKSRELIALLHMKGPRALTGKSPAELSRVLRSVDQSMAAKDRVTALAIMAQGTASRLTPAQQAAIHRQRDFELLRMEAAARDAMENAEVRARDAVVFGIAAEKMRWSRRFRTHASA
jgi:hypothetical protein